MLLEIESSAPRILSPPPTLRKDDRQGVTQRLSDFELDEFKSFKSPAQIPTEQGIQPSVNPPSPTPSALEGQAPTPATEGRPMGWDADRTTVSWKVKWRVLSTCLMQFGNGMNDSAPGALIPYMEEHYHIGYAVVSLIFVTNALGFLSVAPIAHSIEQKLGRSKSYGLAITSLAVAYVIIICQPPFPVVVVSFFLLGFGLALNLALSNVYCANLPNATTALGCMHGSYGIGGTVAPLFATAMASHGIRWSFFYILTLGVCLGNIGFSWWAFSNFEKEETAEAQRVTRSAGHTAVNDVEGPTRTQILKQSLKNRTTLLGALFIFAYQGAEVSVSGWVVSFLISYRHGDPSRVGYVSAGFWGGITVGRFLLTRPAFKVGEKIAVLFMMAGAVAFQLLTWLVPNVIGEAVMVAILGVLLGAVYPCSASVFTKLLPRHLHISSLSFISALGSSGGAVSPFFTGLLAQNVGTFVLHPICLGLYGVMAASWLMLPKISKRSE
ncbi:hypothetical protein N7470_008399 [Penicillium chermesinum]|nr:hypothetical protein N7470_008399 [Penicillium chermesinum]